MSKAIPLTRGKVALVDDEDYESLLKFKWFSGFSGNQCYARRSEQSAGVGTTILMHRHITIAPKCLQVDHIDGNGLNNQRANLRLCTQAQNGMNRGPQKNNASGYKGVWWDKRLKSWSAKIKIRGKCKYVSGFFCIIKAAKTYDKLARKYFGEFAYVNFPTSE